MSYPRVRMRRLRANEWSRRLVAESDLSPSDLIWPLFVHEEKKDAAVDSMPGVFRLGMDGLFPRRRKGAAAWHSGGGAFPGASCRPKKRKRRRGVESKRPHSPRAVGIKKTIRRVGNDCRCCIGPLHFARAGRHCRRQRRSVKRPHRRGAGQAGADAGAGGRGHCRAVRP